MRCVTTLWREPPWGENEKAGMLLLLRIGNVYFSIFGSLGGPRSRRKVQCVDSVNSDLPPTGEKRRRRTF